MDYFWSKPFVMEHLSPVIQVSENYCIAPVVYLRGICPPLQWRLIILVTFLGDNMIHDIPGTFEPTYMQNIRLSCKINVHN